MKPVFQTRDNTIDGNCLAASLASIFETEIEVFDISIPDGPEWLGVINEHLKKLYDCYMVLLDCPEPEQFINGYHLVIVHNDTSNAEHALVGFNGKVVHNPSQKSNSKYSNPRYGLIVKYLN